MNNPGPLEEEIGADEPVSDLDRSSLSGKRRIQSSCTQIRRRVFDDID